MGMLRNAIAFIVGLVAWQYYVNNFPSTKVPPRVSGFFHPSFRKVAETYKRNFESGKERGSAFAVYYKGELLVDMWGGWADHDLQQHWQQDTITLSWSMVKGVSAIAIARLVDMGLLNYKKEVYHYWPEFRANNKDNITVEMLVSHQAGLIGLDEKISLLDYRDNWTKVEKLLANQKTFWPAGTAVGYHGLTFGMYVDALVRKVDPKHRNISQFLEEEILKPLDIEFYIGLPKEQYHRFARVKLASFWEQRFFYSSFYNAFFNPYFKIALEVVDMGTEMMNQPEYLSVGLPSAVGIGTARGLAKLYDYLANGGSLHAKRLLSPNIVESLTETVTNGLPNFLFIATPVAKGLMNYTSPQGFSVVGHPGYGGNNAFADRSNGLGVAYFTNYLGGYLFNDPREQDLLDAFYECFKNYKSEKTNRRSV
ncbi:beta-lactamase domain-containing protein 2-like [Physella acuta]|uniref:beta-lactamase domain-containing protein 2-like n=1 Tax=Physella acuta TaxID=109671 RepID=UPI0027DC140B|nr:beta-lactamase domain-containing protein 2-like [Physella acuta]